MSAPRSICSLLSSSAVVLSLVLVSLMLVAPVAEAAAPKPIEGRLIVKYKSETAPAKKGLQGIVRSERESLLSTNKARVTNRIQKLGVDILSVPRGSEEKVRAALAKNPDVEYVEFDYPAEPHLIPNDPSYATKQWYYPVITAPAAWDIATSAPEIVVAIADDGIHPNHPDLTTNLLPAYSVVTDSLAPGIPPCSHGTRVAGVVGEIGNNGIGAAGMAWKTKLLPVILVDNTSTTTCSGMTPTSYMAEAIVYATDNGADIINMSWGSRTSSTVLRDAVSYAASRGVVVVASAGNDRSSQLSYPGGYDLALGVGATQASSTPSGDIRASYSNYGSLLDVMAPGSNIYTTGGTSYGNTSGTSFASPMVAGLAALVRSINPDLSQRQVRDVLMQNADDLGTPGWDQYYGWGRINALATLTAAQSLVPEVDTIPPTVSITAPANGASLVNTVQITATSSDAFGVTEVEFYIDGVLLASKVNAPYATYWSTTSVSEGTHVITAKAKDHAGHVTESAPVTVTVAHDVTPPTVSITTPTDGAFVSGDVEVLVTATDDFGVDGIEFLVDGYEYDSDYTEPYQFTFWTEGEAPGAHTLQMTAYDDAGNVGTSSVITVVLSTDQVPPVVTNTTATTYPEGTTSVPLTVTTDEAATCKYSNTSGTAFSGMTTFTSTGSTTAHSSPLSVGPGNHTYYVRCQDASTNISSELPIAFTVEDSAPSGLVVSYSFDSATISGTQVSDLSGNNRTGVMVSSPAVVAGKNGDALEFNGTSYVDLGTSTFGLTDTHTISLWMKPLGNNASSTYDAFAGRGDYLYPVALTTYGTQRIRVGTRGPSGVTYLNTTDSLPVGSWTHVVLVHDGTARRIYLNGVLKASDTVAVPLNWSGTRNFLIGRSALSTANGIIGAIDDFRIYDHALTDAEITQLAQ